MGFRGRLNAIPVVAGLLSWTLCALPVSADPKPADGVHVAELVRTGAQAATAKRWADCVEALTAAAALEDAPRTWGDLGLCEEQAGSYAAAYMHLRRAMEGAPADPNKDPWTRYQAARARVAERVALLMVTTYPPNARVVLDGRPLGAADGRAFAVDPGTHTIAARLEGHSDASETRTMRAKDTPMVHLHLRPKPGPETPVGATLSASDVPGANGSSPPARTPMSAPPPLSRWFVPDLSARGLLTGLSYGAGAVALASTGVWIGLEVDRASLRSRVAGSACSPVMPSPPATCAELAERKQQRDAAGDVAIATGIAALTLGAAAGLAIGLEYGASRPSVGPVVSQDGGGVEIRGVW
jgi:hypothetical protein